MKKRDNQNNAGKMDMPFLEKFMVSPDNYEIFKFGGTSLRDDERGIRTMLQYFSDYFTEEQIKENMKRYNLQTMFNLVKNYFKKEYGYVGTEIELSNRYQNTINSYIYNPESVSLTSNLFWKKCLT